MWRSRLSVSSCQFLFFFDYSIGFRHGKSEACEDCIINRLNQNFAAPNFVGSPFSHYLGAAMVSVPNVKKFHTIAFPDAHKFGIKWYSTVHVCFYLNAKFYPLSFPGSENGSFLNIGKKAIYTKFMFRTYTITTEQGFKCFNCFILYYI